MNIQYNTIATVPDQNHATTKILGMTADPEMGEQTIEQVRGKLSSLLHPSVSANAYPRRSQLIPSEEVATMNTAHLAEFIDHTLLKPDTTAEQVKTLCREALQFKCASVCVNSSQIKLCAQLLKGSELPICSTIGFPFGTTASRAKAAETTDAIEAGASEIDMVINIGRLKDREWSYVRDDISAVIEAATGHPVKVILETGHLTKEEKIAACLLSAAAGAAFVKTSTGFGRGGATVEDIMLMRFLTGPYMGVKASGHIRDAKTVRSMLAAGANRIGTSSTTAIVAGKTRSFIR